jgi:hypothetical protein
MGGTRGEEEGGKRNAKEGVRDGGAKKRRKKEEEGGRREERRNQVKSNFFRELKFILLFGQTRKWFSR